MTVPLPLLELGLVIAWSSGFIGAKLAADTSSAFLVLFWRFVVVAALLAPFVGQAWWRRGLSLRSLALHLLLGALAMAGYLALGVRAIELGVPLGTAALISALQPLLTAALVGPVLGQRVSRRQWLGLMLGLCGVTVAVADALGGGSAWAYVLSFGSTSSLVVATLLARAEAAPTPMLTSLGIQAAASAILFAPLTLLEGSLAPSAEPDFVLAVGWFVLFSTLGGYGLYWLCLRRSNIVRVGSLIYLTPPVTMGWGYAMFGEPLAPLAILGFALCLVGAVLTGRQRDE